VLKLEINKNELELARLVKEANISPCFLCTELLKFIERFLTKFAEFDDVPSQFHGIFLLFISVFIYFIVINEIRGTYKKCRQKR